MLFTLLLINIRKDKLYYLWHVEVSLFLRDYWQVQRRCHAGGRKIRR
jgi:hypothetical protein